MHPTFWFSILAGYVLGVAAAALVLPAATVAALAPSVGVATAMLLAAVVVAVTVEGLRGPRAAPARPAGLAVAPPAPVDRGAEALALRTRAPGVGAESLPAAEIRRALDEGRVEVFVQPIVSLPQRRAAFYEGYTRIRDEAGGLVLPARYLAAAEEAGLIGRIDLTLLFGCARVAARGLGPDRRACVFCNVSPASLGDPAFAAEVGDFLADRPDLAAQLVLELSSGRLDDDAWRALRGLRRLGLRFSLDHPPEEAGLDAAELARRGIGFVKLGARRFEATAGVARLDPALVGLHEALEAVGITPIVDRIETERTLLEVLDYPVRYGQGFLFGSPVPLAA